jgi:signal transduction histidine kinase
MSIPFRRQTRGAADPVRASRIHVPVHFRTRDAVPLAAGLAAGAFTVACVWPARSHSMFAFAGIVAVAASFAVTGAALAGKTAGGGIGGPLALASLLWGVSWSGVWEIGPLPALSILAGAAFWAVIAWGCLRYPYRRLQDGAERLFTAVLVFLPSLAVGYIVVSRPDWLGFDPNVWWPAPLADETLSAVLQHGIGPVALLMTLAFVVLARRRLRRTAEVERGQLVPVAAAFAIAGFCAGTTFIFQITPRGNAIGAAFIPLTAALLGVPLAFAGAVVRRRVVRAAAADLLLRLASPATVETVRAALSDTLHDPTLQVLYRLPDSGDYVDGSGSPAEPPTPASGRLTLPVHAADGEVVALVHADAALARQGDLVENAVAASSLAVENARLQAILRDELARVRASRARVAEAGLAERRRVERDLHDGAQQRLLTLAAWLGLARTQATAPATLDAIDKATSMLHGTLDELRSLARGIHPAILTQAGLETALDSAAQALPIPVDLDVVPGRFDATVETVAYLTTWDALTHLSRASGVSRASVRIHRGDENGGDVENLWVVVGSDAAATRDTTRAPALSMIEDRLNAFDGDLHLDAPVGAGLLLTARIPCATG